MTVAATLTRTASSQMLGRLAAAVEVMRTESMPTMADWSAALYDAQFLPLESIEKLAGQAEAVVARNRCPAVATSMTEIEMDWHCQMCGSTDSENVAGREQGRYYSGCCNERIVDECDSGGCDHN